jgi:hypothetical protein
VPQGSGSFSGGDVAVRGQVQQIAQDDVEQDVEVVGVEVLGGGGSVEDEVEQLEDVELLDGLAFAVEQEDEVFAKGLAAQGVGGQDLEDAVGHGGGGREGFVGGDHVLFVEDEEDADDGAVVGVGGVAGEFFGYGEEAEDEVVGDGGWDGVRRAVAELVEVPRSSQESAWIRAIS